MVSMTALSITDKRGGGSFLAWVLLLFWTGISPLALATSSYVNTTNQASTGFLGGTIDPFTTCTTEAPNYGVAGTNNGSPCIQFYWQQQGYDGTRDKRGTEVCSELNGYKEGWYGFFLYLPAFNPSFVNSYPTNKQAGCCQIFQNGYCGGSWAALMIVTNNSLYLNYRSYCGTPPNYFVEIGGVIPRNTWVPVIIHYVASHTNGGLMQVWFNGAPQGSPTYGATNINFGFGTWTANDTLVSTNPLTYKFGQYDYDDGNYTVNETRTSYYANVCQLVDPIPTNAWDIVNPGVGSPDGLAANNTGSGTVALSWTAVNGAGSYNIYRSLAAGGPYAALTNVTATAFVNIGLTNGVTYYYIVTATNSAGESPHPAPVNATPDPGTNRIVWTGSLNANWDINATANWQSNASPFVYLDGDQVFFGDTSSVTNVNLANTVEPGSLMVSNNNVSYTFSSSSGNSITGATSLTKNGSGLLALAGVTNNFGGGINMNGGTLDLGATAQSAGAVTLTGGTIRNGTLAGTSYTLETGTVSAALAGNAAVSLTTSGSVILSGNNTYNGPTTLDGGTLVLLGNNSGSSTPISVANSATLQLANTNAVAASVLTMSSIGLTQQTLQLRGDSDAIFATGGINIGNSTSLNFDVNQLSSAGTNRTLTVNGAIAYNVSGTTLNVTGGNGYTLGLGAVSGGQGGSATLNPTTSNLKIASYSGLGNSSSLIFAGLGNTTLSGGVTNNNTKALNLVFNQTGVVTLFGAESLTGGINAPNSSFTINSGTVVLNNSGAFSAGGATPTLGLVTGTGTNTSAALFLGGTDAGGLTGGITLAKNITVEDGGATANSGALFLGGQNTSGMNVFAGNITLGATANTGKSLTLLAATGGEVDFTGGFMANGTDSTAGITTGDAAHAGIIKLLGTNTYAGPTTVSNGTLVISTAYQSGGSFIVKDGNTMEVINSGNGQSAMMGCLTLGNALGLTRLVFTNVSSTTLPIINVSNILTVTATNTIQISGTNGLAVSHLYPLIKYGSLAGAGFSAVGLSAPATTAAALVDNPSNSWIALKVINPAVNTNPANMMVTAAGGEVKLSWPLDHTGWTLEMQTNLPGSGLGSDWVAVAGSDSTNQTTLPVNPANASVFYRLVYP